jgi:hypothetical protein
LKLKYKITKEYLDEYEEELLLNNGKINKKNLNSLKLKHKSKNVLDVEKLFKDKLHKEELKVFD